ncbi:MAG: hypothetical protein KBF28_12515, partial [Gemmatimonadales bacterium]|nr:hypothetical protein [Gemmatimonadales bacterium]
MIDDRWSMIDALPRRRAPSPTTGLSCRSSTIDHRSSIKKTSNRFHRGFRLERHRKDQEDHRRT